MRSLQVACALAALSVPVLGQTMAELASRYGPPRLEIFFLPNDVKLTARYDGAGRVCACRIETVDHSERLAPNLTDVRFWIDSAEVTRLIAELAPYDARRGAVHADTVALREGEHMVIETDESVQITRIQRSRRALATPDVAVADRLVKIQWTRPGCERAP